MPDVRAPEACPTCKDSPGLVFDFEIEPIGVGSGLFVPCPDCQCPSCGKDSPGGALCEPCDWDADDTRHIRLADR